MQKIIFLLLFSTTLQAASFEKYFPQYLAFEGNTIHYDVSTISKYGITIETLKANKKDINHDGKVNYKDVALLTPNDAKDIIKRKYWTIAKCDSLDVQFVADILTDMFVNMGVGYQYRHLKYSKIACSDSTVTKNISYNTVAKINKTDPKQYAIRMLNYRVEFYYKIIRADPRKKQFINGWLKRVYKLKQQIK